jgi:hypothetical protein
MLTTTLVQFPTTDMRLEYDDHIMLWQKEGIKDDHHSLDISITRTATHSFRPISFPTHRMPSLTKFSLFLSLTISGLVQAVPAPAPTIPPNLAERASSCTFSGSDGASSASKSKTSCSTIVLSDVAVPSGTTLDLTDLNDGTSVIFEGTTSFGYEEWDGPLISVSGTDITVTGADGHVIDGDGSRWWDGEGSNGGTTKPKFFYAHDLTSSTISGLSLKNSPVQVFSIDGSTDLTLYDITIDDSDGDDGSAANTDAFDVGESTGIIISGATVYNQDDCLAVNSGTVGRANMSVSMRTW